MIIVPKRKDVFSWGKTRTMQKMAKEAIECSVEGDVLIGRERRAIAFRKQRLAAWYPANTRCARGIPQAAQAGLRLWLQRKS